MANDVIRKALDIAAGTVLIPEVVDGAIRDYVSLEPVLFNALPKVPWATNTYFIRKRTALPTASWGTDGGALPAATNATYAKVQKSVKYLYTRGEVTGPMQAAAGSLFNALAMEVEVHAQTMVEQLSTDLATGTGASDDIEGILHQIDVAPDLNAGGGLIDSTTGDTVAVPLTLALLDQAIDNSRGDVDMIVTSRAVRRKINSLLQAQQNFNDRVEVAAGFRVLSYDGIPIVTDMHWETTKDLLFVRRARARVLVHQDFTYEELAKTKDSTDFMIKAYMGFALEGRPTHLHVNDSTIG